MFTLRAIALTLLLAFRAAGATDWFVRGETGSDMNPGTAASQAVRTFDAVVPHIASGDRIFVSERVRNNETHAWAATGRAATLRLNALTTVTIEQEPGRPPADIRGDTQLVQSGWSPLGAAWQLTLAGAGELAPDAVVYDWDNSVDSLGRHFGHLVPDTLTNVTTASGIIGRYHYNTASAVLSVYLGGDNPNTSGRPVGVCWVPRGQEGAIKFFQGSANAVAGLTFSLYPSQGAAGQNGWALIFVNCTNSTGIGLTGRDLGAHSFGAYGGGTSATGCVFVDCASWSGRAAGGGAFIHFTHLPNTMTGARIACEAHLYRLLGTDGQPRQPGTSPLDAPWGAPFYAHANGGHAITDILDDRCLVRYYEDPGIDMPAFSAANIPPPVNRADWSTYAHRIDRATVIDAGVQDYTESAAFRRSRFRQCHPLPQGTGGTRGAWTLWTGAGTSSLLFESCEFIFDLSDSTGGNSRVRAFSVNSNAGTSFIHMANCSAWNASDQGASSDFHAFFDYLYADHRPYRVYGSVFGHKVSGPGSALCIQDASTSPANHIFLDCAYHGVNDAQQRFSQNPAISSFSAWRAWVDWCSAQVGTSPFPHAPHSLTILPHTPLWPLPRITPLFAPPAGIDGPYSRFRGAWQGSHKSSRSP